VHLFFPLDGVAGLGVLLLDDLLRDVFDDLVDDLAAGGEAVDVGDDEVEQLVVQEDVFELGVRFFAG